MADSTDLAIQCSQQDAHSMPYYAQGTPYPAPPSALRQPSGPLGISLVIVFSSSCRRRCGSLGRSVPSPDRPGLTSATGYGLTSRIHNSFLSRDSRGAFLGRSLYARAAAAVVFVAVHSVEVTDTSTGIIACAHRWPSGHPGMSFLTCLLAVAFIVLGRAGKDADDLYAFVASVFERLERAAAHEAANPIAAIEASGTSGACGEVQMRGKECVVAQRSLLAYTDVVRSGQSDRRPTTSSISPSPATTLIIICGRALLVAFRAGTPYPRHHHNIGMAADVNGDAAVVGLCDAADENGRWTAGSWGCAARSDLTTLGVGIRVEYEEVEAEADEGMLRE
ncbi:hypothetical protein R3P38DRAFT_3179238 [Favolaschia claudopus]|uniref:Uncharacterized protein n=1 Tax=Favolaschia claudopus TaxID=2862362 RepID=A0AAW0CV13_9AGAR